ncbi:hypothetical protein PanWU01x14_094550 [Parasponia andersonii]|uniref:Uncharacterized protein n=1 Tax=Parasponia andersonii TaxID=3476 RepID=A0A2P5D5W3_PARAD|nr:hypothetical protein PanWU01x14_094550 [Parasponia andersonii]
MTIHTNILMLEGGGPLVGNNFHYPHQQLFSVERHIISTSRNPSNEDRRKNLIQEDEDKNPVQNNAEIEDNKYQAFQKQVEQLMNERNLIENVWTILVETESHSL